MAKQNGPGTGGYVVQTPLWLCAGVFLLLMNGPGTFAFWWGLGATTLGTWYAISWIREIRSGRDHHVTSRGSAVEGE